LNQHSPNINELLEEKLEEDKAAVYDNGDPTDELFLMRGEIQRLKAQIRLMETQLAAGNIDNTNSSQSASLPNDSDSIHDIPTRHNPPMASLTSDQIARYSRQLLLSDGFGITGQQQLLSSSILVVGAGGIGSSLLLYLAAAGVGHVTIVDFDVVEKNNLHRQIIHRDQDAIHNNTSKNRNITLKNKAQSAKEAMMGLNPSISVTALNLLLDDTNIMTLVPKHDVIVDASDNPSTRYLLNDACILSNKPLVSGSAMGTEGQLTVYNYCPSDNNPAKSACYRCLYPNPNPAEGCKSCSDNGVLGPVPGLIGVLQAVEVIKIVTGIG
jgi:adenylyltransferase/sulfurtransferase